MRDCLLMLLLAAMAVAGTGCGQIKEKQKPTRNAAPKTEGERVTSREAVKDGEPLLLLDDEPLLLLDDGPDGVAPGGPVADNSRCHVCHINYVLEDIAVIHARANIGCADCHGDSDAHIADESWSWGGKGTAPDIMYRRDEVNEFCMSCHSRDKIDTEDHQPLFAGTAKEEYCTDCHGNHRLAKRRAEWK